MKNVILVICCVILLSCNDQATTDELFKKAHQAVMDKDVKSLQECLTSNEAASSEITKALAKLLIEIKSGDFEKFSSANKAKIDKFKKPAINKSMYNLFTLDRIPNFNEAAATGIYDKENKTYTVPTEYKDFIFDITDNAGKLTFWPSSLKPSADMISSVNVINEFKTAILLSSDAEIEKAVLNVIQKYIPKTSLKYTDKPISGMINGAEWSPISSSARNQNFDDKKKVWIEISAGEPRPNCYSERANMLIFTIEKFGEFDFAQEGMNVTLVEANTNKQIVVGDGKLMINIDRENNKIEGKIVAKNDDNNYVNGNFEIDLCKTIDL